MSERKMVTIDGNEAAAHVAHKVNEVIAIYPITPSTSMGELADQWSAEGRCNLWGTVPLVVEMQSEGGAAGAVHGALQTGSLTTTFTASQGLMLMIPNLYKIAGELTSTVFHVSARSVATHALSIFGDHSDVMAVRGAGWAMLASNSVQEAMDCALIAQAATLEARVPFLHFFDGFRTSSEVMKVEQLGDDDLRAMIDDDRVRAHRARGLSPDRPVMRGSAQNPDVFFQGREAANSYYLVCPASVQNAMDRLAELTGRQYHLFDYVGAADAQRVVVLMGSGAETAQETVEALQAAGEKVGVLKVRLYRPFSSEALVKALPRTVKSLAVLDRCKEPGSAGEPLYQDVLTALNEYWGSGQLPRVIGGRYGLSSKEFTPAMVKAVLDELTRDHPKNHFTVGIHDDVTRLSLSYDPSFSTEGAGATRAMFFGLGSDGTVGANKNSIKIIGEDTDLYAQGYFVYDSKKSGSVTTSHLRFGPRPIHSAYLISSANFVACHQFNFLERFDVLKAAEPGAVFLLNSPYGPEEVWDHLPQPVQAQIIAKQLKFYVIDAYQVARATGMGGRINTIMQTCFFATLAPAAAAAGASVGVGGVLPRDAAIAAIKRAIEKTYGKRGQVVVQRNFEAVDQTLQHLHAVKVPAAVTSTIPLRPAVPAEAPEFVQKVIAPMIAGLGDDLPVSALPIDGTFPTGTSQWEKRGIALEIPVWDPNVCIQCGKCVLVCPHAVIREKVYPAELLEGAPPSFASSPARWKEFEGQRYTLQVSPDDCTGCALCFEVCPAKNKREARLKAINMTLLQGATIGANGASLPLRGAQQANWRFFQGLPEVDRRGLNLSTVKDSQLLQPLFEFSGACAGCGETPYLKLITQLFGDRALIANATGCSSIYGGNLPTTPWAQNQAGRGPAWANSLFEDNAEFGLGFRLTLDKQTEFAHELLARLGGVVGSALVDALLAADQGDESGLLAQRERVQELKTRLSGHLAALPAQTAEAPEARAARDLLSLADVLVRRSIWIVGGDGWAYDIGYGGLDHVLASGRKVNVLVLDTEVYSNTGGQASKSTPRAAVAKFAAGGKGLPKKDLALLAMTYGHIYVARVAFGANDAQALRAFTEAEAFPGPALIIAYSHCISHGYDLRLGLDQQKKAVASGYWPLFRYNPLLAREGKNPFVLDSKPPSISVDKYMYTETRFRVLTQSDPARAEELLELAQADVDERWKRYASLAAQPAD
ncbi:MAG: pyruvate:ferredoxin (flavodoxin) oxidoreductase [Anaerolineales bacterium]|nr:pyruvate:ferredoxin (flavodoxin) oxidoreductase [Anaerolineales bacterium]